MCSSPSLFSYGFVPSVEDIFEFFTAEILVDNYRFEVSPTEIPFELVQYQAKKLGGDNDSTENIEFTPDIGLAIVKELVTSAKALNEERKPNKESQHSKTTQQLIDSLRESHRMTLLACAGGLQDYIDQQQL